MRFALDHYLAFGWAEGRDPGPYFDSSRYLGDHPDVAAAGVEPMAHYLMFGTGEGRNAFVADEDFLWV